MFVTHLESAIDGTHFEPNRVLTTHQGRPLWVRYDLGKVKNAVTPDDFAKRSNTLWRYRELLPLPAGVEPVTLGEGMTPLLACPRLGKQLGLSRLFIKDESQLADRQLQEPRHGRRRQHGEASRPANASPFPRPAMPAAPWRPTRRGPAWRSSSSCRKTRRSSIRSRRTWPAPRFFSSTASSPTAARSSAKARDKHGLVRHVHPQGAVSPRRQEDDGPGNGRAARLDACPT